MYQYIHECNDCKVCTEFSSKHQRDNYKCPCKDKKPLLTIELQDMNSVPIVKYKGEEIELKTHVAFDWKGRTEESYGGAEFEIEHHLREGEGIGHFNTIKKVSTFKG